MTTAWFQQHCKTVDQNRLSEALQHQMTLTKPAGSLGQLEDIAIRFCGWQNNLKPLCEAIQVVVFAGDHGVCQHGVSAFPQAVTAQMVNNLATGGAAISVLAHSLNANFSVVNMGVANVLDGAENLINVQLMPGTLDFTQSPAMSQDTMYRALEAGQAQVDEASHLFIGGEMGIGNTTSASAIYCLLLGLSPAVSVGPGTGLDESGLAIKRDIVSQALALHADAIESPLDVLQRVGGLEIAGLVGAYIACAQQGVPILVDGFIATAAALLAVRINSAVRDWLLFAHKSAEPAHSHALESLNAAPLLDLNLRLGEGSGAGIAASLIRNALLLHNQMATFSTAGVSEA